MTNKERSTAIRNELKKLGYNSRQVSVKSGYCGYSDYSHITIKDLSVDFQKVENACMKFEDVDYDISGEILQGGNTYIRVEYDYKTLDDAIREKLPEINEIMNTEKNHIFKIGNNRYSFSSEDDRWWFLVRFPGESKIGERIAQGEKEDIKYELAKEIVFMK